MTQTRSLPMPTTSKPLDHNWSSLEINSDSALQDWMPVLLVIISGVVAMLPALMRGIPNNYDLQHHFQFALPLYEALRSGTFLPGWFAESNNGFGNYACRFYPPAFYYLLAATRALAGNWYVATLSGLTVVSIMGSLGAYFWARCFVGPRMAVVAGFFYAFMPFHVSEVYQAALLAEFAGGAALLFSFAFLKRVCQQGGRRNVVGLAISHSALILTHLPLAVLGSIALLLYGLLSLNRHKLRQGLRDLATAVLLTICATAFYWARMLFEMSWILREAAHADPLLDYRQNFLLTSFSAEANLPLWWMNILLIATLVMFLPALILFRKRLNQSRDVIALFILVAVSIFMATPVSRPLWNLLPFLQMTQHPFRWLAVTSTIVPILLAASAPYWLAMARTKRRPIMLLAMGALAIALAFTAGQTIRDARYLSRSEFDALLNPLLTSASVNHWLPIWAETASQGRPADDHCEPPNHPAALVDAGDRTVIVTAWNRQDRQFSVTPGTETFAEIHTFYYPNWKATAGDEILPTSPDKDGVLRVALPKKTATVDLKFQEPKRVQAAMLVSGVSWLFMIIFAAPFNRHTKKREATL